MARGFLTLALAFTLISFGVFTVFGESKAQAESTPPAPDLSLTEYLDYLEEFKNFGVTDGTGTFFEISESDYLPVALSSTEEVTLHMESIPETITIDTEPAPSGAGSVSFTLSRLLPSTTYYKYEDGYEDLVEFTTDENGEYSFSQDISQPHVIFIQTRKSTKFIRDDATGGDCTLIGDWDSDSKTCTLSMDVSETISINNNNLTLDGAGHKIVGNNTGNAVFLFNRTGVTIKNLNIENFSYGILLSSSSSGNVITDNNIRNTIQAITLSPAHDNTISGNLIEVNTHSSFRYQGFVFFNSNGNLIIDNVIDMNDNQVAPSNRQGVVIFGSHDNTFTKVETLDVGQAILFFDSFRNIFRQGTIEGSGSDGFLLFNSKDSQVYNNNFINNNSHLKSFSSTGGVFNLVLPYGGNYWNTFDTGVEGCEDVNIDNICDAPFSFTGGMDALPWNIPDGWLSVIPEPEHDPVILIPGITGSYLFKGYDDQKEIWLNLDTLLIPGPDSFLNAISLLADGTENSTYPITIGDIVRKVNISFVNIIDIWDGLIEELQDAGYTEGEDLFVLPYDWRKSNFETAELLKTKVDEILESSGAENIDIVAHSMGGIVAKTYIAEEGGDKIDQLIFLGTPHLGAPKTFKALMYGDDSGIGINFFGEGKN